MDLKKLLANVRLCTDCTTSWITISNTLAYGCVGNAASTTSACQAACTQSVAGCIGIDWDVDRSAGSQCFLCYSNITGFGSASSVTHYNFSINCTGSL